MGSKFLAGGTGDLSALQSGTFPINVASAVVQSLAPSLPVKTSATKDLVSGLIQLADCNFSPITNPMAIDLDMGDNAITDTSELLLINNGAPSTPPLDNLTLYAQGDKLNYRDDTATSYQVATTTDIAGYLPLAGGTMTGVLDMGSQEIDAAIQIGLALQGDPTDPPNGLTVYTDNGLNLRLRDSSANTYTVVTTGDLGAYLPLAGGTMSGTINMGAQEIDNLAAIRTSTTDCIIGQLNTGSGTVVSLGYDTHITSSFGGGVAVGPLNNVTGQQSIAVGGFITIGADRAIAIGDHMTNNTADSILLGGPAVTNIRPSSVVCDLGTVALPFQTLRLSGSVAGPTNTRTADDIVSNAGASISGNLASFSGTSGKVVTDSAVVAANVVTNTGASVNNRVAVFSGVTGKLITDSGATLSQYLPLAGGTMTGGLNMSNQSFTSTNIDSNLSLSVGTTTATSLAIGQIGVITNVAGIFICPIPLGSWYSTTTYNPSFAAGVNRLTPPTAATAGPLTDFTHSLGVLTYTGARTRTFHISYNITFTSGANGSNMTFFNSLSASTSIGTHTQIKYQITAVNNANQICVAFTDMVPLSTGATVQLAGACATLSAAVGYNFIGCQVIALTN